MWVCLYHPDDHVDGEDRGHTSKRQTLQDAAAGVWAVASLSCAVFLRERVEETRHIQLRASPLRGGRSRHKQLRMRH